MLQSGQVYVATACQRVSLCVCRMTYRKKGVETPEIRRSQNFICPLICWKVLAVEMGERGSGYESDWEEGNGRV